MSKLLQMIFETERWEDLLEKAVLKGIDKSELRRLCDPEVRAYIYMMIKGNKLEFSPGHQAAIPKDDGSMRIVYVGETIERVMCSLINDCLFELFPEMVHPCVKSYKKGIGTGKVAQELSNELVKFENSTKGKIIAAKYDYSKFFDNISREAIMHLIDIVERKLGYEKNTEPVCNLMRRMYNCDLLFDLDGNLIEKWSGCRQGNAIGSWIADAVLYEQDEYLSNKYVYYARYSDDLIVIHNNPDEVTKDILRFIEPLGVTLNPKKIQVIHKGEWFKFLGWSFKDGQISLSPGRVKTFQKEIEARTIGKRKYLTMEQAARNVSRYLYGGEYSWATGVLPIINCIEDINTLNKFCMDAIRACETQHVKIGGLGCQRENQERFIVRGVGRNVKYNREHTDSRIDGYMSLMMARNALMSNRDAYECLVRCL